jgi:RHS repeat-associated protein
VVVRNVIQQPVQGNPATGSAERAGTCAASYRFTFNGKENDNEVHGATGTFQDYGMRAYDTRVGRFFKVDPLTSKFPYLTPYQFAGNKPVWCIDLDGLEDVVYWKTRTYENGYTRSTLMSARWSDLVPGQESGPAGHGTLVITEYSAAGGKASSVSAQFIPPPPPPSWFDRLARWSPDIGFKMVDDNAAGSNNSDRKGGSFKSWDVTAIQARANATFGPDKLTSVRLPGAGLGKKWDVILDKAVEALGSASGATQEGVALYEKNKARSVPGTSPTLVKVSIDSVGRSGNTLRVVLSSRVMEVSPSDTVGGVLNGNPNRPVTPSRTQYQNQ